MKNFHSIQAKLVITPGNFFDVKNMEKEFRDLNDFLFRSLNLSLRHDYFSTPGGMYLAPCIDGRIGYFKNSKLTEGGFIRGFKFEELMCGLCAMIIGEQSIKIVSSDGNDLYVLLYKFDIKEIRILGHFHDDGRF